MAVYNLFNENNLLTIDDFGNIGKVGAKGTINDNQIGTNTSTEGILQIETNQKFFYDNFKHLDVYQIGSNVICIYGHAIPKVDYRSSF